MPSSVMIKIRPLCLLLFAFATPAFAKPPPRHAFDSLKVLSGRDIVLNDVIEFTLFDLSEVKIIHDGKDGVDKAEELIKMLPRSFYKNLTKQIYLQKVPVTLYSDKSPSYAKPLQLTIHVRRIRFASGKRKDQKPSGQEIEMHIAGQIKDKASQEVLFLFNDSAKGMLIPGKTTMKQVFESLSDELMRDLALYIKERY